MKLTKNMGQNDRVARALAAVALVVLAAVVGFGTVVGVVALLVAVVLGVTAAVGFCPAYLPFHLNTMRRSLRH